MTLGITLAGDAGGDDASVESGRVAVITPFGANHTGRALRDARVGSSVGGAAGSQRDGHRGALVAIAGGGLLAGRWVRCPTRSASWTGRMWVLARVGRSSFCVGCQLGV